ncbi:tetrapeptide repeat homeobox protein 2-like [Manis pentadactyla]|uniref:tetrapeptide repeat homeobox protein 2-like n=1 Tax=Manis pentadactyla TaxID=143292 RepID=UPI00255CF027|nr:tetrapeptide repeat homeobox protein 2-like [Manis pentadactyla]
MQEPGSFGGSALSSRPPRQRQERTVYSKEQQQELEKRFQMNQYPTYVEREALAARLNLREQQVQVWFKNHRAKYSRLQGLSRRRGRGLSAAPRDPGAPHPVPGPVPAGPVLPGAHPGLGSPAVPSLARLLAASEPRVSCPGLAWWVTARAPAPAQAPAWWAPEQHAQEEVPAAPGPVPVQAPAWWPPRQGAQENVPSVPAPVPALGTAWGFPAPGAQDEVPAAPAQAPVPAWVHDPYASAFSPDPAREADFSPLFSLPDSFKGPPSSVVSRYPEGDDCEDEDSYPKTLLDL